MADHHYEARGAHSEIFDRTDRELLLSGPAKTGADRAVLEKMATLARTHRGFRGLIVRKVAKSLIESAIAIMNHKVLLELRRERHVRLDNGSKWEPQRYQFLNGSSIALTGLDDSSKIIGSGYDMIAVLYATALDLQDWEDLLLALDGDRMGYTQLIANTLPDHPQHWLNLRAQSGKVVMLESRHEDNPDLYRRVDGHLEITELGSDVMATLNNLTGVNRLRNALGLWRAAEGQILTKFDPAIHMIKAFEPPTEWGRIWGFDWGFKHPLGWVNNARAPDGQLILHQQICYSERAVDDHIRTILEVTRGQPRPEKIVRDHAIAESKQIETALSRAWGYQVETIPARKGVKKGIEAFEKRLKHQDFLIMQGSLVERDPKLVKLQLPTCLEEEIQFYVWADELQDHPVKKHDDVLDAERYVIMEEDSVRSVRVRMRTG